MGKPVNKHTTQDARDRRDLHAARVEDVEGFIVAGIDRPLTTDEKRLLGKVPEQILHLLSAAIIAA